MSNFSLRSWGLDARKYSFFSRSVSSIIWIFYFILAFISFALIDVIQLMECLNHTNTHYQNPHILLACFYSLVFVMGLFIAYYYRLTSATGNIYVVSICMATFLGSLLSGLIDLAIQLSFAKIYMNEFNNNFIDYFSNYWQECRLEYVIIFIVLAVTLIFRWRLLTYRLNVQRKGEDTSSNLGSARLATSHDITQYGLRSPKGSLIGKDEKGYLRLPALTDRLILTFRGGGKTSTLLVPLILDYMQVNKFITDIKGELTAITAKKAKALNRTVYVVDPFKVLKGLGNDIETHQVNPLAHLDYQDSLAMDRTITALASALSSSDHAGQSDTAQHFSENAQIILEGILDFYISTYYQQPTQMNLVAFHDWWLDSVSDPKSTVINAMSNGSCKAKAAAAQLSSAGKDESGSMKTTVYRHLRWLRGEHIRDCFKDETLNIDDFVSGACDIYVVLPEDMIKAYSPMVRVILALIKAKLIQTPATQLKKDYCFVLDELGQFGYCPDIELMINTMRYRGVKIWASFQTLEQIEVYKDKAIFKGMPVKHFLGSDDIETLKWIQELGSKTTVLTENVSRSMSNSSKGSKGTVSESYSVSEAATDLIYFNDVREMASDEQYVFIKSMRPIRCKKVYYFKEPIYKGRYDKNPLEG